MVRMGYYTNPSEKKIEIFDNFTGGLNTVTTNSSLSDTELVYLENADLDARGDITRRLGMESYLTPPISGKGQGYFRYYRSTPIVKKNFVKPFTDSSWQLVNGAVASVRTADTLTFSSSFSSGVNVVYTFDSADVIELRGKAVIVSILEYSMTSSDGLAPFSVKTLANSTWTTLATVFADSANTANKTVSMTIPSDATDLKFEIHRDTSSADGLPIKIKQMQLEVGTVATAYAPYVSSSSSLLDEIVAINGKLYKNGSELSITGLPDGFQTTRKIEAVQFQTSLYIATGTKLVEYDGTTAKVVEPYKPVGQEALYIGYNGLFPDPINYASDTTDVFNSIDTVIFNKRYGVINTQITTTIITTKISADVLEYKTEVALPNAPTTFTVVKDWATAATGKVVNYTPTMIGDYAFRFTIRKQGTTGQDIVFNVPKYTVNQTDTNTTLSVATMQTCNRIFVHNDRLCLYGDDKVGNQLYFSHLNKPRYFPVNNTIDFKSDRQEGLTAVVKYRNILVAFTPSNIQALYGTSPNDFVKKVINSSVGCIAPQSAVVVENYVNFVSKEGIFALVATGTVDDRMNVRRLDENIWNVLPKSTDCVGVYFNKQYHLVYPTEKIRFRYYTQMGVWTQDKSSKMTMSYLSEWDGILIGQRSDIGDMVKFDPSSSVVSDLGEVYKFIIETKLFDFGVPYHIKKLKQIQIQMKVQAMTSNIRVYVSADNKIVVNPDKTDIIVNDQGNIEWITSSNPNFEIDAGTILGSWVMGKSAFGTPDNKVNKIQASGKCRSTKIRLEQEEDLPCGFLGVAYIFKLRKPK